MADHKLIKRLEQEARVEFFMKQQASKNETPELVDHDSSRVKSSSFISEQQDVKPRLFTPLLAEPIEPQINQSVTAPYSHASSVQPANNVQGDLREMIKQDIIRRTSGIENAPARA